MLKTLLVLLGLPGSGKGTQGKFLSDKLSLPHISTGDILRKIMSSDSDISREVKEYVSNGMLVSDELMNRLVDNYLGSDDCANGCILDGYPRNIDQLNNILKNQNVEIKFIFFDLNQDIALKRILGRFQCGDCGKLYNKYYSFPINSGRCDNCESENFVFRSDDSENIIKQRFDLYKKETLPMIDLCREKGQFFLVDAGKSEKEVVEQLDKVIEKN